MNMLPHSELLSHRGFLVYVTRTYPPMIPYLKGFHLAADMWRGGRDKEGWKLPSIKDDDASPFPVCPFPVWMPLEPEPMAWIWTRRLPLICPPKLMRMNLQWLECTDLKVSSVSPTPLSPDSPLLYLACWMILLRYSNSPHLNCLQ